VVLVGDDQHVENRVIDLPAGLTPSSLAEAANYLNARVRGLTLAEAKTRIEQEQATAKAELDALTQKVIEAGLATWSGALGDQKSLIVRGQANLLNDVDGLENLERIRQLFDDLETKRDLVQLLGLTDHGEGVRIFIGSENKLFSLSGSSLIVAPFEDKRRKIVGELRHNRPNSVISLSVTYYTGMVDTVAHVPDRCVTADGYEPRTYDTVDWPIARDLPATFKAGSDNIKVRYINFEDQTGTSNVPRSITYFFSANGAFESSPAVSQLRWRSYAWSARYM